MLRLPCWLLLFGACASGTAAAQTASPACSAREQRQFDFWIGTWTVTKPDGSAAGRSRIEPILGGCVILENWSGAGGFEGKSFNVYDGDAGHWEQFWVDGSGSRLHLTGGLDGAGRMVLAGTQDQRDAKTGLAQRERITWTPNPDGSVRQLWETSGDDGKSWAVSFNGLYRRAD